MKYPDDIARAERLAYFKAWRAANPEKVKRHNDNYWRKRAERRMLENQVSQKSESAIKEK